MLIQRLRVQAAQAQALRLPLRVQAAQAQALRLPLRVQPAQAQALRLPQALPRLLRRLCTAT